MNELQLQPDIMAQLAALRGQRPQGVEAPSAFTPELIRYLAESGELGEQRSDLQGQLEQAMALRGQQQPQAYGLGAGIMSGMANVFNTINSVATEKRLRPQLDGLGQEISDRRSAYGRAFTGTSPREETSAPGATRISNTTPASRPSRAGNSMSARDSHDVVAKHSDGTFTPGSPTAYGEASDGYINGRRAKRPFGFH